MKIVREERVKDIIDEILEECKSETAYQGYICYQDQIHLVSDGILVAVISYSIKKNVLSWGLGEWSGKEYKFDQSGKLDLTEFIEEK